MVEVVRDKTDLTVRQKLGLEGSGAAVAAVEKLDVPLKEKKAVVQRYTKAKRFPAESLRQSDMSHIHLGLYQASLPHTRLREQYDVWKRTSGNFTLLVQPGIIARESARTLSGATREDYVGVPYGAKARLVLMFLQTEAINGRSIDLGSSLTAFMRSIGLERAHGDVRGNVNAVWDQVMRISRCNFIMQWKDSRDSGAKTIVDSRIVEKLSFFDSESSERGEFRGELLLKNNFHAHLMEHAVQLDRRAIAHLAGSSVALDLYALLAYRLPRLNNDLFLSWEQLQSQLGSNGNEARSIRAPFIDAMRKVYTVYPEARVEVVRDGIRMKPSRPSVSKVMVNGSTLIEGGKKVL